MNDKDTMQTKRYDVEEKRCESKDTMWKNIGSLQREVAESLV